MDSNAEATIFYIQEIISKSVQGMMEIVNILNNGKISFSVDNNVFDNAYVEFAIYYLAQTDRLLYNNDLEHHRRCLVMNKLKLHCIELAIKYICDAAYTKDEIDKLIYDSMNFYDMRLIEYANDTEGTSKFNEFLFINNIINLLEEKGIKANSICTQFHLSLIVEIHSRLIALSHYLPRLI
ncbi:MAG: hypothetical protein RBU23_05865 [Candidatus Auribacterota bacterium]|jgi:hypothetical protein|nr:hypothetical protein [Candidatus Auribacterota bacterium]